MDLQQLRYVAALAQEKHFQRAAKSVGITQPTLSQQLKKLEEELGEALFERSSRRVALTPAGEKFVPYALAALDSIKKGVQSLQTEAEGVAGLVRIGFIPTIGPYLLPEIIKRLKLHAPHLRIEPSEETASTLVQRVKDGALDLGVLSLPFRENGLTTRSLGREEVYLAVSSTHPLSSERHVDPKRLKGEKLLILQEGHCLRNQTLAFCKSAKVPPQIAFQGSGLASVLNMTAAGEGVTFIPKMIVDDCIRPDLKFLPFRAPRPTRDIGVVWRSSASLSHREHLIMREVENLLTS